MAYTIKKQMRALDLHLKRGPNVSQEKKKRQHHDFQKGSVTFGAALVMRHLQLKTNPPCTAWPAQGPSQAAGTAVADARLIFSGQPRARHTPGLAPGSLARPRSAGARPFTLFGPPRGDRPGSALAATHGLAPAHSSQERRRGARGIRLGRAAAPL